MADQSGGPDWEHGSDGKWYAPGILSGAGWWRASDDRWYRPEQTPQQQTPPPAPTSGLPSPRRERSSWTKEYASLPVWAWAIIAGVVGSVLLLAIVGVATQDPESDRAVETSVAFTTIVAPTTSNEKPDTTDLQAPTATTTPATTTTDAPTTTTPPPTFPPETVSQSNARAAAANYLDFAAFSRSGLIEQLNFEGYSEADATYGVDILGVDWNEQAALKAAEYLDSSAFSRSGLIDQLVYEGFSQAEAEYGVSTTGL